MRKVLYILTIFSIAVGFGQLRTADRYFKEFAYKKTADMYLDINKKGDNSYLVLSRLADSYYFNSEFEKAVPWYNKLMKNYPKEATASHIFRYAQSLRSTGNIEESDLWLLKIEDVQREDSRPKALVKNSDYFSEYSSTNDAFLNVHNISSNTKYSDFGGFIYDDMFYFASTKPIIAEDKLKKKDLYKWNDQPYLNVYKTYLVKSTNKILEVENPIRLTSLSTKYHESNAVITKDGRTMFFTRDNYNGSSLKGDKKNISHLKIYKARKEGNEWKDIQELPFNSDDYSIGHPALSPDEKTLYFVSDMPYGYGETDIYKVKIYEEDVYGKPVNLGREINTEGREMFPFVGSDETLYFSSDGHLGLGALDVFESKIENNEYTKPVNLEKPVNSSRDDFGFVINRERTNGFFSSNRKGGKGDDDIYSFTINRCKEDIVGIVTDLKSGTPIPGALVRLIDDKGEPVSKQLTNEDGSYSFKSIDCKKAFTVAASKNDYRNDQKETATLNVDKKVITANLALESFIVNKEGQESQIVIHPIYFDFDLYTIRQDSKYELENIVSVMKNNPTMVIRIESHTDSRGSKAYNRNLSTNRAKATKEYLISRGIAPNRIESAVGYGEDQLLNNCDDANQKKCSEEQHQRNRRSYFYIVRGGKNITSSNQ
ncbi:OmpA family protein [uncultured Tenacibaculum sp.]|uniref:OmpA family protein n=1 Tax=uncultured Tenacibaculum sp. TaxID=174713 RepID=UPI002620FB7F|nr:OmpA family protein [uncultured Tenacibaculum sp.]